MRYRVLFSLLVLIGLILAASPYSLTAQALPTTPGGPGHVTCDARVARQAPSSGGTKPPIQQPTKPPVAPTVGATAQMPPTKAPLPPTDAPPTKTPLPPMAVPLTKTPWPTEALAPTKTLWPTVGATAQMPTKTPWPTDTPLPTTTLAPAEVSQSASPAMPQPPATGAAAVPAAPRTRQQTSTEPPVVNQPVADTPAAPAAALLMGVVFDDRNGNGVHDPDEPGLPGVAVIVESLDRPQTFITDASGAYTTTLDPTATARVVPPAGWVTSRLESLPLDVSRNFALRQSDAPVATLTQTVLDLAPLVTIGGILTAVLGFGLIQIGRTVSAGNRQLALTLVRMQRTTEQPITFKEEKTGTLDRARDPKVLALLNQAALDATGRSLRIEQVLKVMVDPAAAIVALGCDRQRAAFVVFTPLSPKDFRTTLQPGAELPVATVFEGATHYPLERLGEALAGAHAQVVDAISSGLFVADDLASAFQYLTGDLPVATRTLPRTGRWHLVIGPIPRSTLKVQTGRRGRLRHALIHLTRNLRKDIS